MRPHPLLISLPALIVAGLALSAGPPAPVFDVRDFGAKGDGRTNDAPAVDAAIEAAAGAGGGTVYLPAGIYRELLDPPEEPRHPPTRRGRDAAGGRTVTGDMGRYDGPEPNEHDLYQDFGHSHWQNSLIWGIGLEDVAILGPGRIDGAGLTRRGPGARWSRAAGDRPVSMGAAVGARGDPEAAARQTMDGQGNKAIALKLCRNVRLQGFSILNGGHFAILATGVDNLSIDDLTIDTNRDGIDIDACRHVRISNTARELAQRRCNRPEELVRARRCEGHRKRDDHQLPRQRATTPVPSSPGPSGGPRSARRTGTARQAASSSAPSRAAASATSPSSNCVFDRSRGLALETVDGGDVENVTVTNLTMRDVTTAPLFLRIGNRGRTPGEPPPGRMRRIAISNVVATDVDPRYPALIAGLAGHPVEEVALANIRILYRGGGTRGGRRARASRERGRLPRAQHVRHAARVWLLSSSRAKRDAARRRGRVRDGGPAAGVRAARRHRCALRPREGRARAARAVRAVQGRARAVEP